MATEIGRKWEPELRAFSESAIAGRGILRGKNEIRESPWSKISFGGGQELADQMEELSAEAFLQFLPDYK